MALKVTRIIVSILFIVFCHSALAQRFTLAIYDYNIPNAANEHNKLLDQHLLVNEKYKAGDTGSYVKALFASVLKLCYGTKITTCICNEHYNAVDLYDEDSLMHIHTSFNHYLTMHRSGRLYHILNYDSNSCYTYYQYKDTVIENCRAILEHKYKLLKTGRSKMISKWTCEEYSTDDGEGNTILLWYSKRLPWYVNPGVYGTGIKKGLVRIKYKGVSITLYDAKKIDSHIEWPKCKGYISAQADLLQWCIGNINNALGLQ